MNKLTSIFIITLILQLLSACNTMNNTTTFIPVAAESDLAVVYIYRPSSMTNALYSPGLTINGDFKLYTKNGVNSRLSLPPGEYTFAFQEDKGYTELTPVTLTLAADTINFIRVSTSLKIKNSAAYEPYARSFKLTQVAEELAVKEIAECCADNSDRSVEKAEVIEEENSDGFSVDKTQNPFSH